MISEPTSVQLRVSDVFVKTTDRLERSRKLTKLLGFSIPLVFSAVSAAFYLASIRNAAVENLEHNDLGAVFYRNERKASITPSVEKVLRAGYQLPSVVLSVLPHDKKYELLTKLQIEDSKARPSLLVSRIFGSSKTGRLGAMASILSYARHMNRVLIVIWDISGDDEHVEAKLAPLVPTEKQMNIIFVSSVRKIEFQDDVNSDMLSNYRWVVHGSGKHAASLPSLHDCNHLFVSASGVLIDPYVQLMSGIERLSSSFSPSFMWKSSFSALVDPLTFPNLSSAELTDRLHRLFSVPRVFLAEMSDANQRRLLYLLDRSKSKRVFFLHAQFGLGNRLRALGSAMAVANASGFVLVLIWVPDVHLNCNFNDLFANDMVIMSRFSLEWPPSAIHSNDRALSSVDFYNFMRHEGNKQVHNPAKVFVNPRVGRHVYAKTAYVVQSRYTPRIISYSSTFWNTMRETLVPVSDVMSVVEQPDLKNIRSLIGVHIRSRRIKDDIKGVGQEFYGKGSVTTDFWRNRTNYWTFAKKIAGLPKNYRYFVAADTPHVIETLSSKFGSHRFYSVSTELTCVSRSVICAKLALADIILLSRTRVLLGSHWSSFSEAAVRMSGRMKVHLAGLHFS